MDNKLNKILIVFLLLILSVGIVSAADADGNQSSDELAISMDLPDNLSDVADDALGESDLVDADSLQMSEINDDADDSTLTVSNDEGDNAPLTDEEYQHIVSGNYNGGKTSEGYTIYCADEDLVPPTKDTDLIHSDTSILLNSFYDTNAGELLKIFVYNYYDDLKDVNLELFQASTKSITLDKTHSNIDGLMLYFVWSFTDSPYRNINPEGDLIPVTDHRNVFGLLWDRYTYPEDLKERAESNPEIMDDPYYQYIIDNDIDSRKVITDFLMDYVGRVVKDYDAGVRIPDIAKKQISDDTFKVYDFVAYLTPPDKQNLFGYKFSYEDIEREISLQKISLNKTVYINNETEFLIVVENIGNVALNNVFVKEDKYDGLEYVTYKDSSKKWSFDGVDKWTYAEPLNPGEPVNFTVVFKAIEPGVLTNYIVAGSDDSYNKSSHNTTTVYKADMEVEKTTSTPLVTVGDEVIFTITVTNTGNCDLGDVRVVEEPPSGFTFQTISDGDWKSEDENTFIYGNVLKAGESASFDITYLTSVNGTYTNVVVATSNMTWDDKTSQVKGAVRAPKLSVSKIAQTSEVIAGREVIFVIEVTNVGDCDIDDVKVVEEPPSGFTYQSMSGDSWKTSDGNNFEYGDVLVPGESSIFEVTYLTSSDGSYQNIVYVYSSLTKDKYETDDETVKVLKPELEINKVADDEFVYVGDKTSFTITVTNTGECDLTGVVVEDVLPSGLTYVGYENGTGEWNENEGKFYLAGSLKVGESATLIIEVLTTESGNFTNCASVYSDDADEVSSEDHVTVYSPSLEVDKVANDEFVYAGEKTSFTITVRNTGDCDLTGVFVEDAIPEGLEYAGYENGTGEWSEDGGRFYLTQALKAGEDATLIINVLTTSEGNFTNCVTAGSNQTDNQTANDTVEVKEAPKDDVNETEVDETVIEDSISAESSEAGESLKSIAVSERNATGNPVMLLMVVLSLIGLSGFRKDE